MCGRVIQSSEPLAFAIVDGMDVRRRPDDRYCRSQAQHSRGRRWSGSAASLQYPAELIRLRRPPKRTFPFGRKPRAKESPALITDEARLVRYKQECVLINETLSNLWRRLKVAGVSHHSTQLPPRQ